MQDWGPRKKDSQIRVRGPKTLGNPDLRYTINPIQMIVFSDNKNLKNAWSP